MAKVSAGILPYRVDADAVRVLLVHPGGPLWANKWDGAWSIPKGELEPGEPPEAAAVRELREETGWSPEGPLVPLGTVTQKSGKVVHGFGAPLSVDPATLVSGTFAMEWPRGSGLSRSFPEVDRAEWFTGAVARTRILEAQFPLIERLFRALGRPTP